MKKKYLAILGSTGSIGKSVLEVIKNSKIFKLKIIYANKNFREINHQINEFNPKIIIISDYNTYLKIKNKHKKKIVLNDLNDVKKHLKKIDVSVAAISGIKGLESTILFTSLSKKILIANKESIICGWNILMNEAKKNFTEIVPIDSEHFSINFLLKSFSTNQINKIYITASGGPFLNYNLKDLKNVKPAQAIKHPKWKMGKKISVDSATLINKILEVIEASKLFSLALNKFKILVHPQSLIHSIIELKNGLKIFLYHEPNMKIPIANALLNYKEDLILSKFTNAINDLEITFKNIDEKKFPISSMISKIDINNSSAILFNAANEILVDEFLNKKIKFTDIYRYLKLFLNSKNYLKTSKKLPNSINKINKLDLIGRQIIKKIISKKC